MTEEQERVMHLHILIDMMLSNGVIKIEHYIKGGKKCVDYKMNWMGTWLKFGSITLHEEEVLDPNKPPPGTPIN